MSDPCDGLCEAVPDALARTVRLSVDRSNIDAQRLCPECFAQWITHYQNEMSNDVAGSPTAGDDAAGETETDDGSDIIVD